MKKVLISLFILVSFFCSVPALYGQTDMGYAPGKENETPAGEAMIADVLIARPIGFVALVVGTGVSIVATPFALVTGTTHEVYGKLVADPFNFTVRRPLGNEW
jgi:hypothetical protein